MPRVKQRRPRRLPRRERRVSRRPGHGKKKAYKPYRKRRMLNKMRPIVEGKMRDQQLQVVGDGTNPIYDMPDPTEPFTWNLSGPGDDPVSDTPNDSYAKWEHNGFRLLPLYAFTSLNQGLHSDAMVGRSIYSRWLNVKIELSLPGLTTDSALNFPFEMFLIHGWVTAPTSYTSHTDPVESDVTRQNINDYIKNQIVQYFDTRKDRLAFIPKITNNLRIEGYKRIKANRNKQLNNPYPTFAGSGASAFTFQSSVLAPINLKCSFKTMRKIHYTRGDNTSTNEYTPNFYPNNQQLPFVCFYCPQYQDFENQNNKNPLFRYNVSHYYTDA